MSECRSTESFCGDTGCPVHGQPEPQPVMLCPACLLDVPLSKAATESIAAELRVRGLHVVTAEERATLDAFWAIPDGTLRLALRAVGADNWVSLPESIRLALRAEQARRVPRIGDQIAPDTAEPAEKQPDSR